MPPQPVDRQQQQRVARALRRVVPAHCLLDDAEDTRTWDCDGLTVFRQLPMLVALPEGEAQLLAVLRVCASLAVPVVARGAGTGLAACCSRPRA